MVCSSAQEWPSRAAVEMVPNVEVALADEKLAESGAVGKHWACTWSRAHVACDHDTMAQVGQWGNWLIWQAGRPGLLPE